ncbi:glycosyltransferase family 2 protein [uncultured Parolsenella sp.]|uniref:glycosyltransferase family 2 protein n=1 Tax=uncultured Parolsenella sp. TaxID=2083008 RepID=UPI0025CF0412|nr:glycosyltransferase family 2 protein [uncultured Parolsenella sp.]
MKFSIIVPVYNSALYLRQCLDSIASQIYPDFEVVLVDDGSTDCSQEICLEYANQDERFRYYQRKENGGASAARNDGIELSSGSYILFVDNDDWIAGESTLSKLDNVIRSHNEPDIIAWPMGEYLERSGCINMPYVPLSDSVDALAYESAALALLKNNNLYSSASGKIVKRELITSHSIRFKTNLRHNEDSDWTLHLLYYANSICWVDTSHYVYRRNSLVSTSSKATDEIVAASLRSVIDDHLDFLAKNTLDETHTNVSNNYVAYLYLLLLANIFLLPNNDHRKEMIMQQKNNRWLLSYDAQARVKLARLVNSLFGIYALGTLLSTAMRREKLRLAK